MRAAEAGQLVRWAGQKVLTKRYRTRLARTPEFFMQVCKGGQRQAEWERAVGGEEWCFADAKPELMGRRMAAVGGEAI